MAVPFVNHIDLNLNQLQNACIHNLSTVPTGVVGRIYVHATGTQTLRVYINNEWVDLGRLNHITPPNGSVSMNGQRLTDLASPTQNNDAVTKAYVDGLIQGIKGKQSVRVASTGNVNISAPPASIDTITLNVGDRVLLKNQTAQAENGIYVFNGTGSAMTRASDADTWNELISAFVFVEEGQVNQDSGWLCTVNAGGTLGTTNVTWVQFSQAGVIEGDGTHLVKNGTTMTMANMPAWSVKGNSTNASGAPQNIQANADGQVLRVSGTSLGFGTVTTAGIADGAVTTGKIANDAVDNARLANMAALSVKGNATNAVADPSDIVASVDGHVLRRSGNTLGFGQVVADGIADNAVTTAKIANGQVTNDKLATVASGTIKGRIDTGNGAVQDLTAAQARSVLGLTTFKATGPSSATASWAVTHNLNTTDVIVQVFLASSTMDTVYCDVQRTNANTVTLLFGANQNPNTLRVLVMAVP